MGLLTYRSTPRTASLPIGKDNVKQAMPPELSGRMRRTFGYAHLVLFSLVEGAINLDDPALDVHRALGNAGASEGTRQRLRELGELYVSHTRTSVSI